MPTQTQYQFYTLLRKHANEWCRAYNKSITYKGNYTIGLRCLEQAEYYNGLADTILNLLTIADWKRWQYIHQQQFAVLWFKLTDLYGVTTMPDVPVAASVSSVKAPAYTPVQLVLFA